MLRPAGVILCLTILLKTVACQNQYKVVLTQKRSIQFVEFEVDVPVLEEFTLCFWIKPYDLRRDQPFFHYLVGDSDRVVSLWLEEGGEHLKAKIFDRITLINVDWTENIWRHICLTWNSDLGLWSVYSEGEVLMCDAADSAYKKRIPGGGRLILGYGPTERGIRHGLRGEIFGFNMILLSTYESARSNLNIKKPKPFDKGERATKFEKVIFDQLSAKKKKKPKRKLPTTPVAPISTLRPVSFDYGDMSAEIELEVSRDKKRKSVYPESVEMFETTAPDLLPEDKNFADTFHTIRNLTLLWKIINDSGLMGKFTKANSIEEQTLSETGNAPTLSEVETPPPVTAVSSNYFNAMPSMNSLDNFNVNNGRLPEQQVKLTFKTPETYMPPISMNYQAPSIPDYEVPPPPQKTDQVYGHWSSGSFPNIVLDFIKSQNSKGVPPTIKQKKYSDTHPYPSEQIDVILPPPLILPNRIIEYEKRIYKRETRGKEYNVRIIENDVRQYILDQHQNHKAENVEITHRGDRTEKELNALLRHYSPETKFHVFTEPKPFQYNKESSEEEKTKEIEYSFSNSFPEGDIYGGVHYSQNIDNIPFELAYAKKHYTGNKWHNLDTMNDRNRSVYFKKPIDAYNQAQMKTNKNIAIAYEIAKLYSGDSDVLSTSQQNKFHKTKQKSEVPVSFTGLISNHKSETFRKPVKLGNTLNELEIIGENRARSFVGGDDKVPELSKYRSDIDKVNYATPPSLEPRVCQQRNSVLAHSPAVQLVESSYKKCTQTNASNLVRGLTLVSWNKTPIRFFGGLQATEARRKCGYF